MDSQQSTVKSLYDIVPQLEIPLIKDLFESNLFGSFILDEQHFSLDANEEFLEALNCNLEKLKSIPFYDLNFEGKSVLKASLEKIEKGIIQQCSVSIAYCLNSSEKVYLSIKFLGMYDNGEFAGTVGFAENNTSVKLSEKALSFVAKRLSKVKGAEYYDELTSVLAKVLNVKYAYIANWDPYLNEIKAKSFWCENHHVDDFKFHPVNCPTDKILQEKELLAFINNVDETFPNAQLVTKYNLKSFIAIPLINSRNEIQGVFAIMDDKPLKHADLAINLLQIYSSRTIIEMERESIEKGAEQVNFQYHQLFDKSPLGIGLLGPNGEVYKINDEFCRILNVLESMVDGLNYQKTDIQSVAEIGQTINRCVVDNQKHKQIELEYEINGESRWVEHSYSFLYDENDAFYMALVLLIESTEKKKAQLVRDSNLVELNKSNEQLRKYIRSNMQLENFAYITSHDLKEPIRSIGTFVNLLERRLGPKLEQDEKEYMDFVTDGVKNMNQLIDDLLIYSRVNTTKETKVEINLSDMLFMIEKSLEGIIQDSKAQIIIKEIPEIIVGSKMKIKQLFQNVIINALKFKKLSIPPIITLNCHDFDDHWKFSISDNGIGIKPEFHDKIFSVFKKLHTKAEYDGSGIGLSICKTVAEHHGGKIWVESDEGEGAIFHFSLKKDGGNSLY